MSQDPGYADTQVYFIRPYLPEAEIKRFWSEDYHITSLAYGDNQWVVIIAQGARYADIQLYVWRDYFPEAELQEY